MPIGACPCGAQNVNLAPSKIKALIDKGMTDPICRSCEQRVLAKIQTRKREELVRKGAGQREIDEAIGALAAKVTDKEPTESKGA